MAKGWKDDWRAATVLSNREFARGSRWITLRADDTHPLPYEPGNVLGLRIGESVPPLIEHPRQTHFHIVGNGAMLVEMEAALALAGVPAEFVSDEYYFNWDEEASDEVAKRIAGRFRTGT